jgi:SAM-dependent methyltransferase
MTISAGGTLAELDGRIGDEFGPERHVFSAVDEAPDPAWLIANMDAADGYPAVERLRAWTANALNLGEGEELLDVGCGTGAAAIALSDQVGATGHVRGLDASVLMIAEATRRAAGRANMTFEVGDATALGFADASFDAYRSERTFQWLADADRALSEAVRVVRPGGRIVVADTDWGTLALDYPDEEMALRYDAISWPVPPNRWSGRRLLNQFRDAGLEHLDIAAETIVATRWDPDESLGVRGLPPFVRQGDDLHLLGFFSEQEATHWLQTLQEEARRDRFFVAVTMFAVFGLKSRRS